MASHNLSARTLAIQRARPAGRWEKRNAHPSMTIHPLKSSCRTAIALFGLALCGSLTGFAQTSQYEDLLQHRVGFGRNVTGGTGGTVVIVTNLNASGAGSLKEACESVGAKWIRFNVSGTITLASTVNIKSNKTIDGRGQDITIRCPSSYAFWIYPQETNIIFHNLKIKDCLYDAIRCQTAVGGGVWVDHLSISNCADECLDFGPEEFSPINTETAITVSWCRFFSTSKGILFGSSARSGHAGTQYYHATIHHCFFDTLTERCPKTRFGMFHIFNNYVYRWMYGGAQVSCDGELLSQNNVFEPKNPIIDPGNYQAIKTIYTSEPNGNVRSEGDWVISPAFVEQNGAANVFDATTYYSYTLAPADAALRTNVTTYSGWAVNPVWLDGLPSPWQTQDIGAVGATGSASYAAGTFTVAGSGADIWGTADEFRYVYQAASGNCEIKARVVSQGNTNAWAKAGVMIRESLTAGSRHSFMDITPSNGLWHSYRTSTGGTSASIAGGTGTVPYWVRVVRSANTFTTYKSTNGTSWTQVDSRSITMGTNVYIGLAVTSHSDGVLSTATFDNVTVVP